MSLKQIQIGQEKMPISMPRVTVAPESTTVLAVKSEHTSVDDTEDASYALDLKVDGKTITKSEEGLFVNLKLYYDDATKRLGFSQLGQESKLIGGTEVDMSKVFVNETLLKTSAYDETNGKLTLTFNTKEGDKNVDVDLSKLIDINDVSVKEESKKYLTVAPEVLETDGSQAVFSLKVVNLEGLKTEEESGLADAYNVAQYIETKTNGLNQTITELKTVKDTSDKNKSALDELKSHDDGSEVQAIYYKVVDSTLVLNGITKNHD